MLYSSCTKFQIVDEVPSSDSAVLLWVSGQCFVLFPVSDCQWKRGGEGGVFLQEERHLKHAHCPGRQTCK